jgi:hypothetical protein
LPKATIVNGRKPKAERLRALTVPTLVLLAGRSRTHNVRRVEANARKAVENLTIDTLPSASHHTIPTKHAEELNRRLGEFLA